MSKFPITGIQLDATNGDNLDLMASQTEKVMRRFPWIQLIMYGELSAYGTNLDQAQPMPGIAEKHFCSLAKKHDVWLIPGSLYEMDGKGIYNTAPVIDPKGKVVTRHRKIYPFEPYEIGVESGTQHTVFEIPGVGRFGVSICYDMWFPETVRALACMGAEVILHPTLTSTIDRDLELSIVRSCAVTNQCYFVDINSCGELANGKSIVVGPEGEIIHISGTEPEAIPVILDLDKVRFTRENGVLGLGQPLKSFRDRKIGFPQYGKKSGKSHLDHLGELSKPDRGSFR